MVVAELKKIKVEKRKEHLKKGREFKGKAFQSDLEKNEESLKRDDGFLWIIWY